MSTASTTVVRLAVAIAGLVVGLTAVVVAYDWGDVLPLPDLVAGLAFTGLAVRAWPISRATFWLSAAFVATWFAGTVLGYGAYWHRGVLIHLLLAFPGRWPSGWAARLTIVGGYAASATPYVWSNDTVGSLLAATVAIVAAWEFLHGPRGRDRRVAMWCVVAFAVTIAGGSLARALVPRGGAVETAFIVYSLTLAAIALALAAAMRTPDRARLADLVVELGDHPSSSLTEALSRSLGDAAALDDPMLADTVAVVERMTTANRALQDEVRERIDDVEASRRRLLAAADGERLRLQGRLREQVAEPLAELEGTLDSVGTLAEESPAARALDLLHRAIAEIGEIAVGLHPRELEDGVGVALEALARLSPLPVELSATPARFAADIEAAAYYVCAEALANAIKHADASRITIAVTSTASRLEASVSDDGVGGADASRGSGLRGLADRVDALGGRLELVSPAGGGTTLRARLPLGDTGGRPRLVD